MERSHYHILPIYILILLLFSGCKHSPRNNKQTNDREEQCCCPPTIYLQPFNDFSLKEAREVQQHLKAFLNGLGNCASDMEVEILPPKKINNDMLNSERTRYHADKIINSYKDSTNSHVVIIGMLHEDISIPYKGKADWGVLGFSYKGGHAGVASSYRLKNNRNCDFWKIVAHEFVHAYFNYGHCPKDSAQCIIKDAKGKANFSNKTTLCGYCKEQVWKSLEASFHR